MVKGDYAKKVEGSIAFNDPTSQGFRVKLLYTATNNRAVHKDLYIAMIKPTQLLIATNNKGKLRELSQLFSDLQIVCITLRDVGLDIEVEETGATYGENALLKATVLHRESRLPTLADDSGLEVDALEGRPGVHTARYAGPNATNQDRWNKLLNELKDVPDAQRAARFKCAIALVTQGLPPITVEGVCEGRIAFAPAGDGGFGYDPVFFLPEYNCTMAELDESIKNKISHRARAAMKAKEVLRGWLK
jgi:XTP/dITP diphosphohydrolase